MVNKKGKNKKGNSEEPTVRVKLPRGGQTLGLLEQRLGASRTRIKCIDGNTRICRIPGRLKRYLWVREGDIVLVEPWELNGDEKGDILYKYRKNQVKMLRNKGYLKDLEDKDEF
ncbi:MAG: translation initiation factor eIF-1A [Nanobdellota archaeon]